MRPRNKKVVLLVFIWTISVCSSAVPSSIDLTLLHFLGYKLHEEAYWLSSRSKQNRTGLDEYVKRTELAFQTVELVSIQPY